MAFTLIERMRGAEAKVNRVAVARQARNNQLSISFTQDVLAQVGSPNFLAAYIGTGVDTGQILLVPVSSSKDGYKVHSAGVSTRMRKIGISGKAAGILGAFKTTTVPHEITDKGILITLPNFVAEPAQPRRSVAPIIEGYRAA